ncbi:MAG: lmo0937 family membrane protein [Flavobacterium sp.]
MFKILYFIAGLLFFFWCIGFLICNESVQIHILLVCAIFSLLLQKYLDRNPPKGNS